MGLGLSLSEQLLVLAVPCLLVVGWLTTRMIPDRGWAMTPSLRSAVPTGTAVVLQGSGHRPRGHRLRRHAVRGCRSRLGRRLSPQLDCTPCLGRRNGFCDLCPRHAGRSALRQSALHQVRRPPFASVARRHRLARIRRRSRHRPSRERAGWIRLARSRARKRHPDDPQRGRSGGQRGHRKSGGLGGRLWLGRLRRGTGRDRRNRSQRRHCTPHCSSSPPSWQLSPSPRRRREH